MQVLCRSWCALTLRVCCLMRAATAAAGVSETPVKLTDEVRLDKVKRWNSLLNSRNVLQDREDLSGVEKIKEDRAVTDVSVTRSIARPHARFVPLQLHFYPALLLQKKYIRAVVTVARQTQA